MNANKEYDPDKIRQDILEAAEARFNLYGYNKTTMSEIAKDCDMSAANLYRFFQNKLDIGANLACRCLDNEICLLKSILDQPQLTASDQLEQFVITIFEHTHAQWSERPRMNELVIAICNEKMSIVDEHMSSKLTFLVTLIEQGNESGEFDVSDPTITAEAILSATVLFDVPLLMPMFSYDDFLRKAKSVVDLILKGVLKH